ncbi:MAG: D-alanyl-D-alanine carboxypeptidase [Verrucomicrobia bacterium]|nr:D-alanyl-D-alanine carboxypeptidase [Verrucomicrobiota bacterium]
MWLKFGFTVICSLLSLSLSLFAAPFSHTLTAESAILINADTGKILFAKNAHQPQYPASITKMATGLYAIKYFSHLLDKSYKCSQKALGCLTEAEKSKGNYSKYPSYVLETDMTHMGLKVGEEMSFRDLLLGHFIVSADDASNVIAEIAGNGSIEHFMKGVNSYLASIGLKNTKLLNPHGLHHPEHVTTALDVALLAREAMKDPLFAEISKMVKFERPQTNKQKPVTLLTTNKFLVKTHRHYYPFVTGGKTGYHRRARHNLVSAAEKNGRKLIAVTLHVDERANVFEESKRLFEAAFAEKLVTSTLVSSGKQPFSREIAGGTLPLTTYTQEPLALAFYPSEQPEMRCQLVWDSITLPVQKGDRVGYLQLLADGVPVKLTALFAAADVEMSFFHALYRQCSALIAHPASWIALGALFLAVVYFKVARRKNPKPRFSK